MRRPEGIWKYLIGVVVLFWVGFIFYTSIFRPLHPLLQGGIALIFALIIVYLLYPISMKLLLKRKSGPLMKFLFLGTESSPALFDLLLCGAGVFSCLYVIVNWESIVMNPGMFETQHLLLGAILILVLLEATRRSVGIIIAVLVGLFIVYALFGYKIPGRFGHPGFSMTDILYQLYLMTEGIWGMLTDLTSRIIAPFILLGPILFTTGVGDTIIKLSLYFGGRITGGSGHVAVASSSLFGMLSGSSVANAATTGAFTIPLMKRTGFSKEFASAVEAAASSGGQIMPPVMGAGVFVMAEFLGIPYVKIMIAALIPAIIYFVGISVGVWLEAKRKKMAPIPKELTPTLSEILQFKTMARFILPIGTLVVMLFLMLPPQLCAIWAVIVAIALFLLFEGSFTIGSLSERLKKIYDGFYDGIARTLAWLMVMMACVQIIVALISLTGFGVKISEFILELSGFNKYLALTAGMLTAIILGMGMTTTAAYIIGAAVLGGALKTMGFDPIAVHLFIFYFAIKSGITPPVCITVFTTSAIAGANWLKSAIYSMKLGIGGYILPFLFVFYPAYLMKGNLLEIALALIGGSIAMFAIEAGVLGHFNVRLNIVWRTLLLFLGILMMIPKPIYALSALVIFLVIGFYFSKKQTSL